MYAISLPSDLTRIYDLLTASSPVNNLDKDASARLRASVLHLRAFRSVGAGMAIANRWQAIRSFYAVKFLSEHPLHSCTCYIRLDNMQ